MEFEIMRAKIAWIALAAAGLLALPAAGGIAAHNPAAAHFLFAATRGIPGQAHSALQAVSSFGGIAVPEPSGWALLLAGLVLACIGRLRLSGRH